MLLVSLWVVAFAVGIIVGSGFCCWYHSAQRAATVNLVLKIAAKILVLFLISSECLYLGFVLILIVLCYNKLLTWLSLPIF